MKKKNKVKIDRKKLDKLYQISSEVFEKKSSEEFKPIIDALKDKKLSKKLERHLKNYLIIRLVTFAESFFENKAKEIIDKYNLDVSSLLTIAGIKDLGASLKNTSHTKGELIASNFTFQNIIQIDFVFSKLIGVNFFQTADFFRGLMVFSPEISKLLVFESEDLFNLFDLRHRIVHNLWTVVDYDKKYLIKLCFTMMVLLISCETLIEYQLTSTPEKRLNNKMFEK